jgi:DNA polymerase III alpha subunit
MEKIHMKVAKIVSERPGLSEEKAKEIWDAFEKFGGYGFNKSHSPPMPPSPTKACT